MNDKILLDIHEKMGAVRSDVRNLTSQFATHRDEHSKIWYEIEKNNTWRNRLIGVGTFASAMTAGVWWWLKNKIGSHT